MDLCLPRHPQAKGKIERGVRDGRWKVGPLREPWDDLGELQLASDERLGRGDTPLRQTAARLVIEPAHQEGSSTGRVHAPQPLDRMGPRLQELAAMARVAR